MSQYLLTDEQVNNAIRDLPVLSKVVSKALDLMDKDDLDFNEIAETLQHDPGISSRVLKLANSSFYGLSGQIASMKEACTVLGIYTLRNILLSAAALECFPVDVHAVFDREALWLHSFCVAGISKFIARNQRLDHDAAFTAGLLHDIGKFVLDSSFPNEFKEVLKHSDQDKYPQYKVEKEVLGIDHSSIGSHLARKWNFPDVVVSSIASHHDVNEPLSTPIIDVVHIADLIAHELENAQQDGQISLPAEIDSIERLGLTSGQLTEWLPDLLELQSTSKTLLK